MRKGYLQMINTVMLDVLKKLCDNEENEYDLMIFLSIILHQKFQNLCKMKTVRVRTYINTTKHLLATPFYPSTDPILDSFWRFRTENMDDHEEIYTNGSVYLQHKYTFYSKYDYENFRHVYRLYYDNRNIEDKRIADTIYEILKESRDDL